MNIYNLAKEVNPCQRNFDLDKKLPNEHVKQIINACTAMPTKQNKKHYRLFVIEDPQISKDIFVNAAYDEDTPHTYLQNGQTYAPLLLLWDYEHNLSDSTTDISISIGISSGTAAIAAASLGYKTGFCRCFSKHKLSDLIKKKFRIQPNNPILMLGIGLPNLNFDKREAVLDGKVTKQLGSFKKEIQVIKQPKGMRNTQDLIKGFR